MSKRRSLRPAKAFVPDMTGTRQNDAFASRSRSILASWRQRCLVSQAMALALWNAPAFAQNLITPDGRTQTNVSVNGATTTITTQTVSGGAGYNSFSRFEQAAGTTVNMHLPQNTGALVNIVRDGPVVVNGILNSYRNGQIGGHIYFSDSAGFTVGPSGVINTGKLTVNTPTREFLDQVIGPNGVVNEAMAARLRANDVPISPDGAITIDGRINARRGVTLNGHSVSVAGQINANAAPVDVGERRRRHGVAFAQSVNTNGLRQGATMVARRGGGIEIVAAGTASISGSLNTRATAHRPAGSIAVRSGKGTAITATARITATGAQRAPSSPAPASRPSVNTADGGTVSIVSDGGIAIARGASIDVSGAQGVAAKAGSARIFAGTNLDVASGAVFRGAAGSTGDGGFLELSARDTVTIGAIDVDLSARNGKAGLLYIDPINIVIGTGGNANMITNGTDVVLSATNKITIVGDGIIDTRNFNRSANGGVLAAANPSLGNSGNITLTAPEIAIRGKLLADVSAGSAYSAGDVTLNATQSQTLIAGPASASAGIKVSGMITGRDITMTADARAKSSYADASAGPLAALAAQTVGGLMFGLNGGYVGSTVSAKVEIEDGAQITATRDVKILANGVQEASLPAITISGNFPWGAAVSIAEITGEVKADVASGARISVGRNLDVNAFNDVNLMATALSLTTGSSLVAATVAYGALDIATSAKVHSGAVITGASVSRINVSAGNSNTLSTSATAMATAGSVGGIAFAYSDYKASAEAQFGADLGSSGSKVGSLTVQATSDTDKNATSAATTVGNNALFNAGPTGSTVSDLLTQIFGKLKTGSSSVPAKVGSAIAVANSDLSASAAIAADPSAAAPSIYASGDVVVAARQRDFGVRVIADSSTNSNSKDPTAANPSAQVSVSFGIGVGEFKHNATASIGEGVIIEGRHIGVAALNEMPIANTWQNWGGLGETFSHLNGNMGVVNNILTTYANASSQADQLGLAGAINYFRAENNSSAYIASGARLKQTGATGAWSTNLDYSYTQNWDQAVHVAADTVTHSIDVGGNFAFLGGTTGGGSAVGGSLLSIGRDSETVAAIAAGVNIEATGVAVTATTSDKMFVIATTSGESAGTIGLNGIVSLSGLSNRTLASISNQAIITASYVAVKADQLVSVFGLSGALVAGGSNAIGAAVAVLDAGTITRAYIGDNSGDLSGGRLAGTATQGLITANTVDVAATTEGRITVASAAGAAAGVGGGGLESFLPPGTPDFVKDAIAASNRKTSSSVSLTGSGASAVALTTLGTSAWIDNAVLAAKGVDGLKTTVTALNSTIAEIGAGSAAINLAGNNSPLSGALAGAVAIGQFDNSTDARIAGSQLTGIYDTTVQAISGGRATVVGLGVAGASSNGGAIAISAALGLVTNRVAASIADSSLSATQGLSASQAVRVNAYQTTDIGIGGGAAYGGGQVGVGMALTYADIRDPDGQDAVSAKVLRSSLTGLDSLQVRATNASRIASSAATGGLGGNGLGGAFVINRVTPTTSAAITGVSGALATVSVLGGTVTVLADGSRVTEYDDLIAGRQALSSTDASQVDFSGRSANGGTANPAGAAVLAIAGVVQAGRNNAGVALLDNRVAQSHLAAIDFANVSASGRVSVVAQEGATLTGVAIGLGVATGQFAGTASVVLQSIENVARAHVGGTGTSITGGIIDVTSTASSAIRGGAGSLSLGFGAAAAGLSIIESHVANTVSAEVDGARLRASSDVVLRAGSTATIDTFAMGVAMSRNVGLAGAVVNNSVATDVGATVTGADIIASNNLGVLAGNNDHITAWADALGVTLAGPSVAGGLSIVNNTIGGETTASIGADSVVDARGGGTGSLSYNAGQLVTAFDLTTANDPTDGRPSLVMASRSIHGLGVVATSQQSILSNAVTSGLAIFPVSAAIAIVPIRNVLAGSTSATIDDSLVNTRLTGTDSTAVAIEAASHSYAATFITVGSVGGVAAAGADANTIMGRNTHAGLTNSTLGTATPGYTGPGTTALDIAANASQSAASNVLGFAIGFVGAAASGVVNSFAATTTATLDQGLVTAGRVGVNAESRNGFYAQAVSGTAGGAAMGSSFVVGTSRNTTLATIGGGSGQTVLNLNGALAAAARSVNAFTTLSAGGAAGGFAGVAGMVSFVDIENETRAGLYGVAATLRPASAAGISVTANESITIDATTAAGATGSFGAGAAVNIANLDSRVLADITGSTLSAPGAVSASATSDRTVDASSMTYGEGGSVGIAAAVAVISVGTGAPSGAGSDLNAGGNGTLARVDQLTAGNSALVLSASGLGAYRSYRGTADAAMSDAELRDAAQADYNQLLANGTVANGALTLTSSGVAALRSAAATALDIASPTDTQVQNWAAQRYTALSGGAVSYLMSDAGVSAYRATVIATTPDASADQIRSAANDAYARLLTNGTVSNGVLTLSTAGLAAYRAEATANLGHAASDAEVRAYAAEQYSFFNANRSRIVAPAAQSASALLDSKDSRTAATVTGGSITSGSVAVSALSRTTTSNIASGVAAGGAAGGGAATAYTDIGDKVSAKFAPATATTGAISVTANSTDGTGSAARVESTAGAGALAAAAGAAVAKGTLSNQVTATLGGALTTTGATTVSAVNSQTGRSDAFGATVAGGLALGVSLAKSAADSTVAANYLAGSSFTGTGLSVSASSTGAAHAAAIAGVGGLLAAGAGAQADADDSTNVSATIGAGASANVGTGTITVAATASPDAKASALGVAVAGGLAVGVAIADASAAPTVRAAIENNASLPANQFTAGRLSVLATGSVFGTPVGNASQLPDATGSFGRGGTSAAASAIAGSGAYYVAATGTEAKAHNTASVTASVGNYVRLPTGIVTIAASNTTTQAATATGVTIGGSAAIGAVKAQADSGTTTLASLGNGVTMAAGGAGSFSLTASGSDTQIVHAKAGSGGLYAGSGAEGVTGNTATVTTSIGGNATINTGFVTIAASHDDRYASLIDSLQASAVGASAALGRHDAVVHVLTSLGAGSRITAAGPNTAGCYLSSCLQAVSVTSRNAFTQLDLGDSVQAAAGGGINGAGATSTTDITGTSKVVLADDVGIASGTSPTAAPGPMLLQAWTELTADDTASLTTGGLLQGAGVATHYSAHVDNEVTLGSNDALSSFGAINIGTYTTATVRANAYVSTYGLAGVGVADADVTVITNNNVKVGSNASLIGLADVNVVAGREGSGLRLNSLTGTATALGYVRGLVAVPVADASTDLQNRAKVQVDAGATISSAQNVGLGAYDGLLAADADGTGHGYQLYFIPVTSGTSSPGFSSTSTLVMNGTATAGIYNTQRIEIGCGPTAAVQCGPNDAPTIRFISGAPVTAGYSPAFNMVSYVNANYDPTVAGTLISGVSTSPVKAVRLSQLYASGGNVRVSGSRVEGNGTLTAKGGPSITVINRSNAYLILDGGAYIPETTGGQIIGSTGSLTRNTNPDATPVITIDNSYTGALDASGKGPGLLISGDITNLSGLVSLNNTQGSFGFSGQRIDALQFNTTVPNGAVVVSSNGPNGMYNAGAAPQAEYGGAIYYPGGGPGGALNVDEAVFAAANALAYGQGATNLNYFLYGKQDEGTQRNFSMQFYGNCIGYIGDAGYACTGGYDMGNNIRFMVIPDRQVYRESNPAAAGGGTKIYGAQVAIKATTININAAIEAGRITNWSGTVDAGMAASLRSSRQYYLDRGYVQVGLKEALGGAWSNEGAAPLYYDLTTDKLVLWDVNASSGGGSVLLDGQIISTNTIGSIKVNGGFGNVSLSNQSGLELITNRINTGTAAGVNASVSKITIIDRLITSGLNTKIYAYTPGSGIAIYKTMNGAQPTSGPVEFISGATASYDPVAGTRYEWTQQALLQKEGLTPQTTQVRDLVSYWRYDSGTSSNPWVYVDAQSPSTNPGANWMYWWSRNAQAPSGGVSGRITNKPGLTGVGLTQEITGGQLDFINNEAHYSGCNGQAINHCDRDFVGQPGAGQAIWNYQMVTRAFVQVTASVKADNRFGISFAGNAAGAVNVTSNSSILQNGTIVNPSGTTTITASGGSFTQTNNATILSNNLNLTARDAIGTRSAAIQATLTSGAQLSAVTGSGGINLDITGSARVAALRADGTPGTYGDIRVRTTGSLDSVVSGATTVIGRNITLSSETGSIGSIANPMKMRAVATLLPNGTYVDGVVNITALGDIGIVQVAGDLRVGEIASEAGNVRIDVNAGRLVSATGQTAAQALSADQLSEVSRSLKLTSADGADAAAQASIASFEKQVTQSYGLYISLMRNGSVSTRTVNGVSQKVFTLNDNAVALYQAFADATLAEGDRPASAQQVKDYASARYGAYSGVFETAYGSGWASQTRFNPATAVSNFSFSAAASDAAPGLATRIAGDAVWTDRQLVSAINKSALQPASGVVGNGTALVAGHDVTLNIAGSIGSLAPDMQIALDAIRNGSVTDAQLAGLSVATTAGSVKIMGQRQDGSLVEVTDLGNVPSGVTLTRVDVKQTAPLFVNATGTFSASAQGDAYVQATTNVQSSSTPRSAGGTLTIGRVTATGTINLQAPQGIVAGTQADGTTPRNPVQVQTGGDLVLAAGGGGIGSAATPLTYQIGGRLVSASAAAGDAYLVANAGNAEIGRIFASGTASLTATSGGIRGYLPGIAISASSVQLKASGNVGSASAALGVQVAATGSVSGQIGGQAWLAAPAISGQSPSALRLGAISAANGFAATADGEIDVLGALRSSSGAIALTGARIVMSSSADIQAAGRASLASGGDITLGHVTSTFVAPAGTASILITAAGAILANGDTGTLLDASGIGGVIALQAGSGLGSTNAALTFAAPSLSAHSLTGDIHLSALGATRITSLLADAGAASLIAGGNLTVDTATIAGRADMSTTAGTLTLASLTSDSAVLEATGLISVGSATTTVGAFSAASSAAGITAGTIDAAGASTLTAAGPISVTTSLTSGGATSVTTTAGTLGIASLTAGTGATLSAAGTMTLGDASTTTGDLNATSTGANLSLAGLDVARNLTLTAATSVEATGVMLAGRTAEITAQNGALTLVSLTADSAVLEATGLISVGNVTTTAGAFSAVSSGAGITAGAVDAAGAAALTAAGPISVMTSLISGGATRVATTAGSLDIASLTAGTGVTLSAAGTVTLGAASTTAGDLTATSIGANLSLAGLDIAGNLTLTAATSVEATGAILAGGTADITAQNGTLSLASLRIGGAASFEATGLIRLTSATTTTGAFSAVSSGAGITAVTIDAAGAAMLAAAGRISATTALISGGATSVTTTAGTLDIASLTAGMGAALSAAGTVTLGAASTTAGDLAVISTGANLSLAGFDVAGNLTLTAATSVEAGGALVVGGTADISAQNGTLTLVSLISGDATSLEATGRISLTSATTTTGAFSAVSSGAGITAGTIDAAGAAILTAAGPISVTTSLTSGGATSVTTTAGALGIASLTTGTGAMLSAAGTLTLGAASTTVGDLTATSTGANLSLAGLDIAGNLTLTAATSVEATGAILAGRTADITAQNGALTLVSLRTGGAASLEAIGLIRLTSATTTAGAFSAASSAAGITAGTIDAAGATVLTAAGPISVTTSLTSGGATRGATTAGSLDIASLTAGAGATLSAAGAVTLGAASTTAGDLAVTSTGANLSLAGLDVAGSLTLTVATLVEATGAILTGGTADITAQNGTLTLVSLISGGATSLEATDLIRLTSATTTTGAFSAVSSGAGITAGTIDAAGAAMLTAAGPISVTTSLISGGATSVATTAGSLDIASLTAGAGATLSAAGTATLGYASTTVGDLNVTSTGANLSLAGLDVAGNLALTAATSVEATGAILTDGTADIAAQNGTLTLANLTAGNATLEATGLIRLTSATTTAGAVSAASSAAGITAGTIDAAGAAALTAAGPISVTTALASGGAASVTTTAGSLGIASLTAGTGATLLAGGSLTLGAARTTTGDLSATSTGANLSLAGLDVVGNLTLTAATSVEATGALLAGGAAQITAQNGALTLVSMTADNAALEATGLISVGNVTTTAGAFSAASSAAGITAGTIDAAGAAMLTAAGPISVTTSLTSGGATSVTTTAGTLDIASLTAGTGATLSAAGTLTLGAARTTTGDLSATSTGANLSLAGLDIADNLTLTAATSVEASGALLAGSTADITAQNGVLTLVSLTADSAVLEATGLISLSSATTTTGTFSAGSSAAGITAGTIDAAGAAMLTAAGPISVTTSLTSGGSTSVTTMAGALDIASLTAGTGATLSAAGTVTLGDARATAGDLTATSTGANLSLAGLDIAGNLTLTAATSVEATGPLLAGRTAEITAQNGTLTLVSLISGGATSLEGTGLISLSSATTTAGAFSAVSSAAGITAGTIDAAGAAVLTAAGPISVTTALVSGGTTSVTTTAGTLGIANLTAGTGATLSAAGTLTVGNARTTTGDLTATSTGANLSLAGFDVAGNLTLTAGTSVEATGPLLAGRTAEITAQNGALTLVSLTADSAVLEATGLISVSSATTTMGAFSAASSAAGITAGTIDAAGAATLTAAGPISVTTSLTSGGATSVTTTAGSLGIASLTAGTGATLSAAGTVTLGDARTGTGDLTATSTGANLSLAGLDIAGNLTLMAATSVEATGAILAGGTADITAQNGTLSLATLQTGGAASLEATGLISLTSATTAAGAFSAVSSAAGITVGTIDAAGAAALTAADPISVTTALTSGGATSVTTTAGTLDIASLTAGTGATLSAAGTVTLGAASTTAGDLNVTSTGANLSLAGLDIAGNLTLTAATSVEVTGAILAGGTAEITAQNGTLSLVSLRTGGAASLEATGPIRLTSARTTAGAFSAVSSAAGITAGTVDAAGEATLTAAGPISVTTALTSGGATSVTTTAGTLDIASLTAGTGATLSAAGTVTLGAASTMAGGLAVTSTGADVVASNLSVAESLSIAAADAIDVATFDAGIGATIQAGGQFRLARGSARNGDASVVAATIDATSLRAGGALGLSASGAILLGSADAGRDISVRSATGTMSASDISAGNAASLDAAGSLQLGTVSTGLGGVVLMSRHADVVVRDIQSSGDLSLVGLGTVSAQTLSARDVQATASAGPLTVAALDATRSVRLRSGGGLSVTRLVSGGGTDAEAAGRVTIGALLAGGDIRLLSSADSVVASNVNSGGSAVFMAADGIEGGTVAAHDTLALLAGRSGQGSITIETGAARRLVAGAPDAIRFGRFSAGESIVVMGTRIAADIVHLPGGGLPLALDVSGFRARSADRVDLTVEAARILASRIDATDGHLTTTAGELGIAQAFVPGAFAVRTPFMTVLANNRTLVPDYAYDAQLYAVGRPFYLDLNGSKLRTDAYIIRFDSDVVDIPPSAGGSVARDVARLGALLTASGSTGEVAGSGLTFGTNGNWRGFWAGIGSWRGVPSGQPLEFVASAKPGQPPVNLDATEEQP